MHRRVLGAVCLLVAASTVPGSVGLADGVSSDADAKHLVAQAMQAEIDGNLAQRRKLLSIAVDVEPDFAPARWQSAQVRAGNQWLPIEQAQAAAAANPKRSEYNTLRAAAGESLDGQLELARWCRKNAFDEEAKFHWRSVLARNPNHEEALKALGVRWYAGRLLTPAQIEESKAAERAWKAVVKESAPRIARWERMLSVGDLKSRNEALAEIRAVREAALLPAIEQVTLDQNLTTNAKFEHCLWISEALLDGLGETPGAFASESLARHAIFSPLESVRAAAVAALKKRSPHGFVPQLLAALAMPVESSYRVVTDSDSSVHYFHSLYREGQYADWSFEGRLSAMQHDLNGPVLVTIPGKNGGADQKFRLNAANNPVVRAEMASIARTNEQQFNAQGVTAQTQIANANRATISANAMVIQLLTSVTGQNLGDDPRAWWDWWQRYNEYSSDDEKPVQAQSYADSTHRYYRAPRETTVRPWRVPDEVRTIRRIDIPPPPPMPVASYECFAAGTPVWTHTGLRPIESLEIGDIVLAQSEETGELSYKPVVGTTVRKPSPCRRLAIGNESLVAASGHAFWVTGVGWRMVKELADGATLHSVDGPVELQRITDAEAVETYNLVVADFNTFFVGKSGVLVHDNSPRQATSVKLPGMIADASD